MRELIESEKIPIKSWVRDIEQGALEQAKNLANLPFAFKHVALMPDCHEGYGMPIGGVLATRNVVIPNAVGVDIGCGMCALQTSLKDIQPKKLQKIINRIKETIPVGFEHHKFDQDENLLPERKFPMKIIDSQFNSAKRQVGTLGGGNHFIEIQKAADKSIWIMIHSGSRNLGKQVADNYNNIAKELNVKMNVELPKHWQLAYLPTDTEEAQNYLNEMNFCVDFAFANRKLMIDNIKEIFEDIVHSSFGDFINIAHNYARIENHFGENVIIHRKGATSAGVGEKGIIPGSQGTKSFIVSGKGNPESFESCSHGAGRKLGRKQAQRSLNLKREIEAMNKKGILHDIRTEKQLDEAPGAYKDIDLVMKNQEDLVEILVELIPLAVIKG